MLNFLLSHVCGVVLRLLPTLVLWMANFLLPLVTLMTLEKKRQKKGLTLWYIYIGGTHRNGEGKICCLNFFNSVSRSTSRELRERRRQTHTHDKKDVKHTLWFIFQFSFSLVFFPFFIISWIGLDPIHMMFQVVQKLMSCWLVSIRNFL